MIASVFVIKMKSSQKRPGIVGKSCKSLFQKAKNDWCDGCKKKKGCIRLKDFQEKKKAKRSEVMVLATSSTIIPTEMKRIPKSRDFYEPYTFFQRPIPLNAEWRKESTAEDLTLHFDFLAQHQIKELKQKLQAITKERDNALLKVSRAKKQQN